MTDGLDGCQTLFDTPWGEMHCVLMAHGDDWPHIAKRGMDEWAKGLRASESALRAAARRLLASATPMEGTDGEWDAAIAQVRAALDGAPWGPSNEMVERAEARPMLTVDDRCKSPGCTQKDIYRMVGKCANCNAEPVLVLFTVGHEARQVSCPSCGVERVYTTRLATPEEIPVA